MFRKNIVLITLPTLVVIIFFTELKQFQKGWMEAQPSEDPHTAKQLGSGEPGMKFRLPLGRDVYLDFCYISPGQMKLGSTSEEGALRSTEQRNEVVFDHHFWMGKTQVTQTQYKFIMNRQPSTFSGPEHPVENVTWEDAQEFVDRLNERKSLPNGWSFTLPTEVQWEYACKAGIDTDFSGGSLDEVGWYSANAKSSTHQVAFKKPNLWGLHDMHGNVWEWCSDWFTPQPLSENSPNRSFTGIMKVKRGGSWGSGTDECKASARRGSAPHEKSSLIGFRIAIVRAM
jgi:formylglycine-generating enzyme required for sulfatase activity